jgi:competence protein ComFC
MAAIHPMRIPGRWREGFALDYQTVDSTFLGYDEFGHPVFDTKRTELGELLYRLKYKRESSAVNDLADTAAGFIRSWISGLQLIVRVPPSKSERTQQPVLILAQAIGERLETPVGLDAVVRVKNLPELKNVYDYDTRLRLLQGAHAVSADLTKGKKVLLFDDLYRSGATMNSVTEILYDQGRAAEVFALTITRTRVKS